MGITFVRLSAPSQIREKLETVVQESGKSINEIINAALEKYLAEEYGFTATHKESDDFSSVEDDFNMGDDLNTADSNDHEDEK